MYAGSFNHLLSSGERRERGESWEEREEARVTKDATGDGHTWIERWRGGTWERPAKTASKICCAFSRRALHRDSFGSLAVLIALP